MAWKALTLGVCMAGGCGLEDTVRSLSDVGFSESDLGSGGAIDTGGGSELAGCSFGTVLGCVGPDCCVAPASRCVPSSAGVGECVIPGLRALGELCGAQGEDDCGVGALCAAPVGGGSLRCRAICEDSLLDCGGGRCRVALEVGGESIELCD